MISGVSEGVIDTSDIAAGTVCSYEFVGPFPDSEVRFNFTNKAMGGGGLVILDGNKGALHGRPVKIYRVVQRISNKLSIAGLCWVESYLDVPQSCPVAQQPMLPNYPQHKRRLAEPRRRGNNVIYT